MMTGTPITRGTATAPAGGPDGTPVVAADPFPWWLSFLLGGVSILFGVAMLVWPGATLRVTAFLVGVWLLLAGLGRIVAAFVNRRGLGAQVLSGIVGVLLVVAGIACLRNHVTSLAVLATVVAFMWLFSGLSELVIAFAVTGSARGWLIVIGVLSALVGFAFLVWPQLSLASLVFTLSLSAMIVGAGQIAFAWQARKLAAAT
jgi:uncharacterized membrane protein HdeD (DUF308 family)